MYLRSTSALSNVTAAQRSYFKAPTSSPKQRHHDYAVTIKARSLRDALVPKAAGLIECEEAIRMNSPVSISDGTTRATCRTFRQTLLPSNVTEDTR